MTNPAATSTTDRSRWYQLAACIVAMMAVANLQYAWTLFTGPLSASLGRGLPAIQVAFTCFVVTQTGLLPANAYLIDRLGPRLILSIAAPLVAFSWIGSGLTHSLLPLYVSYAIGGIGVGAVYGASIGLAMKWFPDHRGLCVGIVAGSYGFGTALTVLPISMMIEANGYQSALITWGIIQGFVVLVAAQFLSMPPAGWLPTRWEEIKSKVQRKVLQSSRDYTTAEMLRTSSFYVLYLMMIIVAFSGLMVTAQLAPIATTYGFDTRIVFGSVTVLSLTMVLDGVLNGATRPLFGWISDRIGRYETMSISFILEALAIAGLNYFGSTPVWFAILTGLTFFAWGEIYSLFPSAIADIFGTRYATTNFGIQYTSKGLASILAGPGAALLWAIDGSWSPVLWTAIVGNVVAALAALAWLKPLVKQLVAEPAETTAFSGNSEPVPEVSSIDAHDTEVDQKPVAMSAGDGGD